MSIYLVYAEVVAAAKAAYLDGTLQAVRPYNAAKGCLYSECCAVGAALAPVTREHFDKKGSVDCLIESGCITTDDRPALEHLQNTHDAALTYDPHSRESKLAELRALLNIDA